VSVTRGVIIAFEGLDQSGKATQADLLRDRLEAAGVRVAQLEFPDYTTAIAREIERALRGEREYPADVLQLLFIANRYEHRPRIEAWIDQGVVVLCDRYLASSIAYGEAQGLDPDWLTAVQRYLPQPDLTILLDIAPGTAAGRKAAGRDRLEHDMTLQARARASYLRQSAQPSWCRLDAGRDVEPVAADVATAVRVRLGLP
jgi:dTMP kinase